MNLYGVTCGILIAAAAVVIVISFVMTGGCQPRDGCASGVCMAKPDGMAPAMAPNGKEAMSATVAREKPDINTEVLTSLMHSGTPMTILDARTGKYDDGRRIPGAKALSPESTPEDAAMAIPSKNHLVVTYCANTHCPASAKLAAHLRKLGYTNVLEYPYGIDGWVGAGQKAEMVKK